MSDSEFAATDEDTETSSSNSSSLLKSSDVSTDTYLTSDDEDDKKSKNLSRMRKKTIDNSHNDKKSGPVGPKTSNDEGIKTNVRSARKRIKPLSSFCEKAVEDGSITIEMSQNLSAKTIKMNPISSSDDDDDGPVARSNSLQKRRNVQSNILPELKDHTYHVRVVNPRSGRRIWSSSDEDEKPLSTFREKVVEAGSKAKTKVERIIRTRSKAAMFTNDDYVPPIKILKTQNVDKSVDKSNLFQTKQTEVDLLKEEFCDAKENKTKIKLATKRDMNSKEKSISCSAMKPIFGLENEENINNATIPVTSYMTRTRCKEALLSPSKSQSKHVTPRIEPKNEDYVPPNKKFKSEVNLSHENALCDSKDTKTAMVTSSNKATKTDETISSDEEDETSFGTHYRKEMEKLEEMKANLFNKNIEDLLQASSGATESNVKNQFDNSNDLIKREYKNEPSTSGYSLMRDVKIDPCPKIDMNEVKSEFKYEFKSEIKSEFKSEIKSEIKSEFKREIKSEIKTEFKTEVKNEVKNEIKIEDMYSSDIKHLKTFNEFKNEFSDENSNSSVDCSSIFSKYYDDDDQDLANISKLLSWDQLIASVNRVRPAERGTFNSENFNYQKRLMLERLKDLYDSLKGCPKEDMLADDPYGLSVPLMKHQKHALAWMFWREKSQPKGGILADDMGLGKTLSMISLVLAGKNLEQCKNEVDIFMDDESDIEEEKPKSKWYSKGRKDYYRGGTLIICPASLLCQWQEESQSKVHKHKLSAYVHHGSNRHVDAKYLRKYDLVISTYQILTREHQSKGALYHIDWKRIVLDEAHIIRNQKTNCSNAACELKATYRWALTGTPVHNKELDVYALLKFLRCTPFDDLAHFKKWVGVGDGGHQRLHTIMKTLMLRRTKVQLQARGELFALPNKDVELIELDLAKDEMNVYQQVLLLSRTLFAQFLYQRAKRNVDLVYGTSRSSFLKINGPNDEYYKVYQKFTRMYKGSREIKLYHILVLLLRLRQICCHPVLIESMLEDDDIFDGQVSQTEVDMLGQLIKCAIEVENETEETSNEEQDMSKLSALVLQRSNPVFNAIWPSTKIVKMMEIIKKVTEAGEKAIIVSQWVGVLNILRRHIEKENIATLTFDGSVPVQLRQEVVSTFNNPQSDSKILLLSLTAGGVGLNLMGANNLILFDLHWNPQLEAQAQDRIYRVGQQKDVKIYKFMCKDTVEERIKVLQDRKLNMAKGILEGGGGSNKLTIDDLKSLFGMQHLK